MASQVLKVMTGWFHANQDQLGLSLKLGCIDLLTQLIQPALVDIHLERWGEDLTQTVMDHGHMKVFADVHRDAQDLFRRDPSDEIGKSLATITTQMGRTFFTHEIYLLSVRRPTSEARAGKEVCASLIVGNELQPRRAVGRRYFTSFIGGNGIGHLQNP
jgi:hypothetical protein